MHLATLGMPPMCGMTVIATTNTTVSENESETATIGNETGDMITTIDSRRTETLETEIFVTCEMRETCETRETHTSVRGKETTEIPATGIFVTQGIYAMSEIVTQETCAILAT